MLIQGQQCLFRALLTVLEATFCYFLSQSRTPRAEKKGHLIPLSQISNDKLKKLLKIWYFYAQYGAHEDHNTQYIEIL